VASVQTLRGDAVWEAADAGRFSWDLVKAASDVVQNKRGKTENMREKARNPIAAIIQYRDGMQATILILRAFFAEGWGYAAKVDGEQVATEFVLHDRTTERRPIPIIAQSHFGALGLNVQRMFLTGQPQWPVERTLLTSGILDAAFRSQAREGELVQTPYLDVEYSMEGYDPIRVQKPRADHRVEATWPPEGYEFLLWRKMLRDAGRPEGE
jgi:hypothetical protein